MTEPTFELLRELFRYDPETGLLHRLKSTSNRVKVGDVAGCANSDDYLVVRVEGRLHYVHRIVWCLMTGEWPAMKIDHKDGVKSNNKPDNLRTATDAVNSQNQRRARIDNRSGVLGCHIRAKDGALVARIKAGGKLRHLGTFNTTEEAGAAYVKAKRRLHEGCTL